jgi:hypothetical protein
MVAVVDVERWRSEKAEADVDGCRARDSRIAFALAWRQCLTRRTKQSSGMNVQCIDKHRVPCSQRQRLHAILYKYSSILSCSGMSRDMAVLANRASKAARAAHVDLQALHQAVGSRSDAPLLAAVGADLDELAMKLTSLSTSEAALSSSLAHDVFDIPMSADVKLSHGITYDMKAIARRLRSLKPSASWEPDMVMDERESADILSMIKRYDGAISATLSHHQLCVSC